MFPNFLDQPVDEVAQRLLGCLLVRTVNGQKVVVRIVETEAYDEDDEASHAFKGKTPRNEVMFGPAGRLYVYFTYGMHYCCNIVCGHEGRGSGVLIRAAEPVEGIHVIEERRNMSGVNTINGPAKLCKALDIDLNLSGHYLQNEPLTLVEGELKLNEKVTKTRRIGITKAADCLRRYYIAGNPYVSKY